MKNAFEGIGQHAEPNPEERAKIIEAVRDIDPGAQGSLDNYVTMDFTDSRGLWVEARLLQDRQAPFVLTLNGNTGDALALLELEQKFRAQGIKIQKLAAYHASPEEAKKLREATADSV